jgi:hypothetical protein
MELQGVAFVEPQQAGPGVALVEPGSLGQRRQKRRVASLGDHLAEDAA